MTYIVNNEHNYYFNQTVTELERIEHDVRVQADNGQCFWIESHNLTKAV